MRVLVDTSAFLAVLDKDELNHLLAKQLWESLIHRNDQMVCTNYVLLETLALLQSRFGIMPVRKFQEDIGPILHVEWVDASVHAVGVAAVLTANRRRLSLVDCVSFEVARRMGIETAFAFDQHFAEQGFTLLS